MPARYETAGAVRNVTFITACVSVFTLNFIIVLTSIACSVVYSDTQRYHWKAHSSVGVTLQLEIPDH